MGAGHASLGKVFGNLAQHPFGVVAHEKVPAGTHVENPGEAGPLVKHFGKCWMSWNCIQGIFSCRRSIGLALPEAHELPERIGWVITGGWSGRGFHGAKSIEVVSRVRLFVRRLILQSSLFARPWTMRVFPLGDWDLRVSGDGVVIRVRCDFSQKGWGKSHIWLLFVGDCTGNQYVIAFFSICIFLAPLGSAT
jgi:hypothetical protein